MLAIACLKRLSLLNVEGPMYVIGKSINLIGVCTV